jgi:hypothetical protein
MTTTARSKGAAALPAATRLIAVIDIGSSSIRMAIAEIHSDGKVRTIDSAQQAVSLGKDTFTKGQIQSEAVDECVSVLRSFRELLQQYGISDEGQIRAVATSAWTGFTSPPGLTSRSSTRPKPIASRISPSGVSSRANRPCAKETP